MSQSRIVVDRTNLWKVVTIISSLVGILAVGVFSFQQRTPIIEAITGHKLRTVVAGKLSNETKKDLEDFVKSHSLVVGVNFAQANFQENTREYGYNYSKVDDINAAWKATLGIKSPLFTDNPALNARVVNMINGQIVCSPTKDTTPAVVHPVLIAYSKVTCSIAIPPGYGDFVGWLNIFLSDTPTFRQMESLERVAGELTRGIYERDVAKFQNRAGRTN